MDAVPMTTSYLPMAIFWPLVLIAAALAATYYYIETSRIVKYGNKLPGPKTVPFFGNALLALGVQPKDALNEALKHDIYGNVTRAFIGPKLIVFLIDPRDVEIILSSQVHIDKSPEYRFFAPWLGQGLLISTGEKWRNHRKIIAPTFHLNVLKSFVPLFYENGLELVDRLKSEIGKEFDCHDYMSRTTVDILLETAMGISGTQKEKSSFDYAMAVMKMCNIIHQRQYNFLLRMDAFFQFTSYAKQQQKFLDIIHGLTSRVITKRKADFEDGKVDSPMMASIMEGIKKDSATNGRVKPEQTLKYVRDDLDDIDENDVGEKRRLAFLDLMLELRKNGEKMTDEEIKEEVDTIMFEGHDTTAAGSSFVLCVLGIHQDVQARVMEELNDIFKGSDRPCTFQDTLEMKYLERVILETLRLFPPVPAIARQLNQDVKLVSGDYLLPEGCTVVIPQYKIHRNKDHYQNPEVFDPDNFLPENTQDRHYYAYLPFSAGPRSCVGRKYAMLKLKVLLSTILRHYKITSDLTEQDFKLQVDIILKRSDGFMIKIEPRNQTVVT
ncbi:cytochrome P450 4g15-like [Copidosoma floridanum]|uniref:cytochrome P450 4g15-like n=1 Tax=Copidosoma floridanum TaxID=29053 RepID=UPI0006C9C4A6|nr:cytochrome P450 4g15-like [Copidosoma floridanum]XP_014208574.1 cytochrome P450 4g15-like [Copidosoma floridanum]